MEKEKILFGLNTPLKINLVEITDTYKEWFWCKNVFCVI